jgi:hypothetical protein
MTRVARLASAIAIATALGVAQFSPPASAQGNPTATNVIPMGGQFTVTGKVEAVNPSARTITIALEGSPPLPMQVAEGVSLANVDAGDTVNVHYSRSITFTIASPETRVPPMSTETLGQLMRQPGGVGPGPMTIQGVVTRVGGPNSVDLVNVNGGGVYTLRATDPARAQQIGLLKVGDTLTVSIGPMIATSVAGCGWFGLRC